MRGPKTGPPPCCGVPAGKRALVPGTCAFTRYDATIDEDEFDNKHLIIGFDRTANPLEIMYNVIDEDTINVFHAMKCRKNFLPLIKIRGESNG
jgi:hypothetical protein